MKILKFILTLLFAPYRLLVRRNASEKFALWLENKPYIAYLLGFIFAAAFIFITYFVIV